jgi:hypothetical protein
MTMGKDGPSRARRLSGLRSGNRYAETGIWVWVRVGNQTLFKDVGRLVFTDVVYLGDTSTEGDNFLDSGTLDFIACPHPIYFDDGSALCTAYIDAMT